MNDFLMSIFGKKVCLSDASDEVMRQQRRLDFYKKCFETEAGQFVLADLMAQASKPPFMPGQKMSYEDVTFNLGVKSVVDEIVNTVEFNDSTMKYLETLKTEIMNYERTQQQHVNAASRNTNTPRAIL